MGQGPTPGSLVTVGPPRSWSEFRMFSQEGLGCSPGSNFLWSVSPARPSANPRVSSGTWPSRWRKAEQVHPGLPCNQ